MKTIITIGRQFGSGGKEVGIRVAKELGIPFYDKELLQAAAKKSGLCEKIFENFDERPKSLLYSIAMDSYMFALPGTGAGDSLEQQVYLATFDKMCIRDRTKTASSRAWRRRSLPTPALMRLWEVLCWSVPAPTPRDPITTRISRSTAGPITPTIHPPVLSGASALPRPASALKAF